MANSRFDAAAVKDNGYVAFTGIIRNAVAHVKYNEDGTRNEFVSTYVFDGVHTREFLLDRLAIRKVLLQISDEESAASVDSAFAALVAAIKGNERKETVRKAVSEYRKQLMNDAATHVYESGFNVANIAGLVQLFKETEMEDNQLTSLVDEPLEKKMLFLSGRECSVLQLKTEENKSYLDIESGTLFTAKKGGTKTLLDYIAPAE